MPFNIEDQYQQHLYSSFDEEGGNYNPSSYKRPAKPNTKKYVPNKIKVLILNNPSKLNKKLLMFFNDNLNIMNNKGMFFDWIVVYEDEMEQYEDQQITEFPVLIYEKEQIIGVNAIIKRLKLGISGPKSQSFNRGKAENGESDLRNYFLNEIDDNADEDADEDDVFASTVTQRVAAMNKARQANGQPTLKMSNPEIHERTARSASRQNNYKFDDNSAGRKDPLQHAMNNARKKAGMTRTNNQRIDNLEYEEGDRNREHDAVSVVDIAKSTSTGSIDDELMVKYWENNTESEGDFY